MTELHGSCVIDTSAVIGALLREPESSRIVTALAVATSPLVSAVTVVELGIVAEARAGTQGGTEAAGLLRAADASVVPVDAALAAMAIDGWRRYGKGNHPAALNLGDCFTYALAYHTGLPVLCLGDDFARTDIDVVDLTSVR